jgi:hypothetical protein
MNASSPFQELTITSGKLISHCIIILHLCYVYKIALINLSAPAGIRCAVAIAGVSCVLYRAIQPRDMAILRAALVTKHDSVGFRVGSCNVM